MGDTASNLGNAMDELMRHQPSLKTAATKAIIKLLEEVVALGSDPKYICWKANAKPEQAQASCAVAAVAGPEANAAGSSDEEDEEEDEQSANVAGGGGGGNGGNGQAGQADAASTQSSGEQAPATGPSTPASASAASAPAEKEPVPLVDYIHNVMKFVDAILSNNSTDDHCREFVAQKGLTPLMRILGERME